MLKHNRSMLALSLMTITTVALSGCGGEETDKIKREYDRISDQVKAEYDRVEAKLTDNEKSMAEILESVFLPEESLDKFLDKITPEGGKGGLYAGHFIELNDGDAGDIDIGALYFDISKAGAGSIDGRVSYQQQPCQDNRTLATDTAVKVDNVIVGKLSGSLDTLKFLDVKYVNDLGIETPNILTTFSGKFSDKMTGSPWFGSFEYQDGLGGTQLSSGNDGCNVRYTLSDRANFVTYPLDYSKGELKADIIGTGSQARLTWQNPENTATVLVSQINVNKAEKGANGYVRNQILTAGETQFTPAVDATPTNYAFVVQAFDKDNNFIGYQARVMDLPEAQ